jgi:hypothetical protein
MGPAVCASLKVRVKWPVHWSRSDRPLRESHALNFSAFRCYPFGEIISCHLLLLWGGRSGGRGSRERSRSLPDVRFKLDGLCEAVEKVSPCSPERYRLTVAAMNASALLPNERDNRPPLGLDSQVVRCGRLGASLQRTLSTPHTERYQLDIVQVAHERIDFAFDDL